MQVADLLKEHHYTSGRVFYIVQCDECLIALNSGHHYSLEDLPHAVKLAVEHLDAHTDSQDHIYRPDSYTYTTCEHYPSGIYDSEPCTYCAETHSVETA